MHIHLHVSNATPSRKQSPKTEKPASVDNLRALSASVTTFSQSQPNPALTRAALWRAMRREAMTPAPLPLTETGLLLASLVQCCLEEDISEFNARQSEELAVFLKKQEISRKKFLMSL